MQNHHIDSISYGTWQAEGGTLSAGGLVCNLKNPPPQKNKENNNQDDCAGSVETFPSPHVTFLIISLFFGLVVYVGPCFSVTAATQMEK